MRVGTVLERAQEYVAATYEPSADCDCRFLRKVLRLAPDDRRCFVGKGRTLADCHSCGSFIFDDFTEQADTPGGAIS